MIRCKKLNKKATIPTKATSGSAGFDFYAMEDHLIVPGATEVICTGIALSIPKGWVGYLTHRSSLGFRLDTIASFGIIDEDYRGEIKVKLLNLGTDGVHIKKGDRFAQLVVSPYYIQANLMVVEDLDETLRGEGGIGSSGE